MTTKEDRIYILGAGGFAREVLNIFTDLGIENSVLGFIEENSDREGGLMNGKGISDAEIIDKLSGRLYRLDPELIYLTCAIGTPLRKRWIEQAKNRGYEFTKVVHPSTIMSKWVTLGDGVIICAGNIMTNQISIGDYTIINLGCTIGHDVSIGKYTTVSPGAHISGRVTIGDECFIGTGAVIVENVSIGNRSFIGAGAVVTKDIPDDTLAVGVPAKSIRVLNETEWRKLV